MSILEIAKAMASGLANVDVVCQSAMRWCSIRVACVCVFSLLLVSRVGKQFSHLLVV